jgi:hypothetical protein
MDERDQYVNPLVTSRVAGEFMMVDQEDRVDGYLAQSAGECLCLSDPLFWKTTTPTVR